VAQAAEEITPFDLWHNRHQIDVALVVRYSKVARLLDDEGAIGVARCGRDVESAKTDLDEEQHVERAQKRALHGEEVTGRDTIGLRAQELRPAATSPRSGAEALSCQQSLDRGRPEAKAELAKLPLDPDVAHRMRWRPPAPTTCPTRGQPGPT
jgi:hypothetical protein